MNEFFTWKILHWDKSFGGSTFHFIYTKEQTLSHINLDFYIEVKLRLPAVYDKYQLGVQRQLVYGKERTLAHSN